MNFKVGDEVVVVAENDGFISKERGLSYGDSFTVGSVGTHDIFLYELYSPLDLYCPIPFTEDELILKEVYESPLYKALT